VKIIQRENINIQKWDDLVKSNPENSVFSLSCYLDAVAENWCIYVDQDYTRGIALPYTVRLGVKICYTPIFVRYLEWFGEKSMNEETLLTVMKGEFSQGHFNCKDPLGESANTMVYQLIKADHEPVFGSQAKRMFSKFEKSEMCIEHSNEEKEVLQHIYAELPQKVASLNNTSLPNLERLISALKKQGVLKTITVKDKEQVIGGLFLIDFNDTLLYLKGAFTTESKKDGGMYAAMKVALSLAKQKGLNFDFGGSRVDGVRRFNVNLGGEDNMYYSIEWDNTPRWFKLLKKAKQTWKIK
jgi:hypothetical protein